MHWDSIWPNNTLPVHKPILTWITHQAMLLPSLTLHMLLQPLYKAIMQWIAISSCNAYNRPQYQAISMNMDLYKEYLLHCLYHYVHWLYTLILAHTALHLRVTAS